MFKEIEARYKKSYYIKNKKKHKIIKIFRNRKTFIDKDF